MITTIPTVERCSSTDQPRTTTRRGHRLVRIQDGFRKQRQFGSYIDIRVVDDVATGGRARPTPTPVCLFRRTARVERSLDPTRSSPGHTDPADPDDANQDPDQDGNWDCSGGCTTRRTPISGVLRHHHQRVRLSKRRAAQRLTHDGMPVSRMAAQTSILGLGQPTNWS